MLAELELSRHRKTHRLLAAATSQLQAWATERERRAVRGGRGVEERVGREGWGGERRGGEGTEDYDFGIVVISGARE